MTSTRVNKFGRRAVAGALVVGAGAIAGWSGTAIAGTDYCMKWVGATSQCSPAELRNVTTNEGFESNNKNVCQRVEVVSTNALLSRTCRDGWVWSGNMGSVYRRNIVGNNDGSSRYIVGTVFN